MGLHTNHTILYIHDCIYLYHYGGGGHYLEWFSEPLRRVDQRSHGQTAQL